MSIAYVEDAKTRLFGPGVNSEDRAGIMCDLIFAKPPEVFWPVFQYTWSSCDATWYWSLWIIRMLRQNGSAAFGNAARAREFMNDDDGAFFDSLPDLVTVYRGCARSQVRSVSWTTDRSVAETFAEGHRMIRVPDPVVASAVVLKEAIFTVFTDRNEREVLIDPRRLRKLIVTDYIAIEEAA